MWLFRSYKRLQHGSCLSLTRRTQIAVALVERNSIRSTERMTGAHYRHAPAVRGPGRLCELVVNQLRDLSWQRQQCIEISACAATPGKERVEIGFAAVTLVTLASQRGTEFDG
jgi:hypothetical protein